MIKVEDRIEKAYSTLMDDILDLRNNGVPTRFIPIDDDKKGSLPDSYRVMIVFDYQNNQQLKAIYDMMFKHGEMFIFYDAKCTDECFKLFIDSSFRITK